jgi:pimeloyl-ACP methyl ester carboxylesterase
MCAMTAGPAIARLGIASFVAVAVSVCGVGHACAQLRDVQTSALTANDGTAFEMTSGLVSVAERRAAGGAGRTIEVAVVRIRRAGAPPSTSPHVILAGGPGDSGVAQAIGLARHGGALFANLVNGDVIGIDQRGTGRSVPNLSSEARYDFPLDRPGSLETLLPIVERVNLAEAERFRGLGIDLTAYNTRESADDVADVCRVLGYARATLWGRSYGTHLALATAARHATLVDRLILVSPEGLDHTWKLPSQVDAMLARLEARGAGELVGPLGAILERLRREPVSVNVVHPGSGRPTAVALGAFDVQWIVATALGDPRALATLPSAIREMRDGDFRRLAQIAIVRRERAGVQSAMKMMMDLSSGASADRRARIEREASISLFGNAINFPGIYLQRAWNAGDLGDEFRRPLSSGVPALLLVGDLDPRTPVENAREIVSTLPNARVVVLENAGHQFDLFGPASIREVLQAFLRGALPDAHRIVLPAPTFN